MIKENKYFKFDKNTFIKIDGEDSYKFIQGLITNDIYKLNKESIYTCLLSPQGKFLCDFFISSYDKCLLLESDSNNQEFILNKLDIFRLRSKVSLNKYNKFKSIVINEKYLEKLSKISEEIDFIYFKDPRKKFPIIKIYADSKNLDQILKQLNLTSLSYEEYDNIRLEKSIPDFTIDIEAGKSLLLEIGFDKLDGIDWEKGCYMGQELTARTKYRGNLKKKIFGFLVSGKVKNKNIFFENKEIGFLTSYNSNYAIGIVKINETNFCINSKAFMNCDGAKLVPFIPEWMKD